MFFSYKVVTKEGKEVVGRVESINRTNAVSVLLNKGYTILTLEEVRTSPLQINLFLRVRNQDLVIFSRQIATLFEANVTALRAFNLVAENVPNRYFQDILRDIAKNIESGFSIEKAFQKYQNIFGEFFVSVVAVGERSGTLSRSFTYLADYVERNAEVTSRIRKAMTYPIFVIVTFFAVMILMLLTVIPQVSSILLQSGAELPLVTRGVLALSNFFQNNFFLIIIGILFLVVVGIFYFRTDDGRRSFDSILLGLPLMGTLFRTFHLVRFTSNLSVMLSSGVSLVASLQVVGNVMTSLAYRDMVVSLSSQVERGVSLSNALENSIFISKNVVQIVRIGEETGELARMLSVITDFYDKKLQNTIDIMIDLVQPIVIIVLGISVGVLIGSVIVPIYSLAGAI